MTWAISVGYKLTGSPILNYLSWRTIWKNYLNIRKIETLWEVHTGESLPVPDCNTAVKGVSSPLLSHQALKTEE